MRGMTHPDAEAESASVLAAESASVAAAALAAESES